MTTYKLSYSFQKPDTRDYTFTVDIHETDANILKSTTVTKKTSIVQSFYSLAPTFKIQTTILDQGDVGDCVCNALASCISKQTKNYVNISRLHLYNLCRILDNNTMDDDPGTTIRTACKVLANYGACLESLWPYDTTKYTLFSSLTVFKNSKKFQRFSYVFVKQDLLTIKTCLTTYNTPIVFGIMIYSSFLTDSVTSTGIVPMPNKSSEKLEGGHCMLIVGYNDDTQQFECANSWGVEWGNKGYCYIPYAYILNPSLAADFCLTQFVY